jgi:hypothetical protein
MPRKSAPLAKPPDFPPEKTYRALQKQLVELDKLRGHNYHEAESDEQQWRNLTLNILIHGFGDQSENVSQFHHAKWAGEHHMRGMSPALLQRNFERRIDAFTALLKSSLAELELMIPDKEIAGTYEPGDEYGFYRDLKAIVGLATAEIFIVDNYLDTQLFDIYVEDVQPSVQIRVLTAQVQPSLRLVAEKFTARGKFELRSSNSVHDRVIFVDDRCWVIGQSIKDAAKKKPTYIIEFPTASSMRTIYEALWAGAQRIVNG